MLSQTVNIHSVGIYVRKNGARAGHVPTVACSGLINSCGRPCRDNRRAKYSGPKRFQIAGASFGDLRAKHTGSAGAEGADDILSRMIVGVAGSNRDNRDLWLNGCSHPDRRRENRLPYSTTTLITAV